MKVVFFSGDSSSSDVLSNFSMNTDNLFSERLENNDNLDFEDEARFNRFFNQLRDEIFPQNTQDVQDPEILEPEGELLVDELLFDENLLMLLFNMGLANFNFNINNLFPFEVNNNSKMAIIIFILICVGTSLYHIISLKIIFNLTTNFFRLH